MTHRPLPSCRENNLRVLPRRRWLSFTGGLYLVAIVVYAFAEDDKAALVAQQFTTLAAFFVPILALTDVNSACDEIK
jgi:hypothetical protein